METYTIRQCQNDDCRFRFPSPAEAEHMAVCLKCGAATVVTHTPHPTISANNTPGSGRLQIQLLLDNIRSIYNVGSIFRTADGAGVTHLHLCGITATPDNPKMAKTALGADSGMGWSYSKNGWDTAVALQKQGCQLWAFRRHLPDTT
ncbi:MAG: RNA methyltransferase, partial [Chloroflexi bacterium]|nr:RNA methyltransferase [Chloroflexota bacterium]